MIADKLFSSVPERTATYRTLKRPRDVPDPTYTPAFAVVFRIVGFFQFAGLLMVIGQHQPPKGLGRNVLARERFITTRAKNVERKKGVEAALVPNTRGSERARRGGRLPTWLSIHLDASCAHTFIFLSAVRLERGPASFFL